MGKRDFLSVLDVGDRIEGLLDAATRLKKGAVSTGTRGPLKGQSLAMIFEKPSTRTRVSFEVGMFELGGHALYLNPNDLQLGRGETIEDTARALSRYVDGIMYRAFSHEKMVRLAAAATVPVINGLDDLEHPCQILADLFTIRERKGKLRGLKLAYVGDGNNVCNSLLLGGALSGMQVTVGCPAGYEPDARILANAREVARGTPVEVLRDPREAVRGADVLYTDVWVSMGMEAEREQREAIFRPYQVNRSLVEATSKDSIVMHCLPAHRGLEITDDVLDGPRSVVWDQAENRLHAQKSLLVDLMGTRNQRR